jgi:arylsulfatase A-like enzyme
MNSSPRPNLLFLLIDAFRADRFTGGDRTCATPVLDDLQTRSTVFTNAFSTASTTPICMASIFTGTYPFVHGIRTLPGRPLRHDLPTLAEAFRERGYHTWAEVTGPLDPVTGLNRGFEDYRLRDHTEWLDTGFGDHLTAKMASDLPVPWFGFVHLWELHSPRRITPGFDSDRFGRGSYDRAVSSLDAQLGRVLEALPANTAIVLTADHGEYVSHSGEHTVARLKRSFKWLKRRVPGAKRLRRFTPLVIRSIDRLSPRKDVYLNWLGHSAHIYDQVVHVPLLMHADGLFSRDAELRELVSHVDIFPTLASAFELSPPSPLSSGVDLMATVREAQHSSNGRAVYMEACGSPSWKRGGPDAAFAGAGGRKMPHAEGRLVGLRTDHYKYVRGLAGEEELYDLATDPSEHENAIERLPDVADQLQRLLTQIVESPVPEPSTEAAYSVEEQAQLERRLRDLGYLE